MERFAVKPPLVRAGQPFSPGTPEAQGDSEARSHVYPGRLSGVPRFFLPHPTKPSNNRNKNGLIRKHSLAASPAIIEWISAFLGIPQNKAVGAHGRSSPPPHIPSEPPPFGSGPVNSPQVVEGGHVDQECPVRSTIWIPLI